MSDDATGASARFSLDGRVALVTGAASGLGRAIALGFAESRCQGALPSTAMPTATTKWHDHSGRRPTPSLPT